MRLSTAADQFIRDQRIRGLAPATLTAYESDLRLLVSLATVQAADSVLAFTPELVRAFFTMLSTKDLSMATLHRRRSALAAFARWGLRQRLWATDPMLDVPTIRRPRKLPRPFTPEERAGLLALDLPPQERVLRAVLYWTGLRVTPICGIRIGDISLGDGTRPGTIRTLGKGRKEHVVPVIPELREVLFDYLTSRTDLRPTSFLFAQPNGRPWRRRMVERRTRAWGERAGVADCTPHRFRHTYATQLLERGADIRKIQALMAHADIATTVLYTQVTASDVADTAMLLSRRRGEGPETGPVSDRVTGRGYVPRQEGAS